MPALRTGHFSFYFFTHSFLDSLI